MRVQVDAEELPRRMRELARRNKKALRVGLQIGAQRGRAIVVRRTPVDTGQLKAAWRARRVAAHATLAAVLENDAPHAGIIEHGARPHPVSVEGYLAIVAWARRHGMAGRSRSKAVKAATWTAPGYGVTFRGNEIPAAKAALAIVRKIRKHGQEPTYFVRKAMPALRKAMAAEVIRQLKKAERKGGG